MPKIRISPGEKSAYVPKGENLFSVLREEGVTFPCGGKGICGKCKIRFVKNPPEPSSVELKVLTPEEISSGIRLACCCRIEEDAEVALMVPQIVPSQLKLPEVEVEIEEPLCSGTFAAADIGTSTVYVAIHDAKEEKIFAFWNPQRAWGDDVISRLQEALQKDKKESMRKVLIERIKDVISKPGKPCDLVSIAGNPAMTAILADEDIENLARYPFSLGSKGFRRIEELLFLPEIGGFLGSDALSLLTVSKLLKANTPYIAMDIGTNTEMFLVSEYAILGTSLPAGPAFEGFGISQGMAATDGAIYEVEEDLTFKTIGPFAERGICGSGLVSAIYALKKRGFITEDGKLLAGKLFRFGKTFITQKDVRSFQTAKAAVHAGIKLLLKKANLVPSNLRTVLVAGSFGGYLKEEWLKGLNILPEGTEAPVTYIGNVALWGAKWSVLSVKVRKLMESLKNEVEVIQLAEEEGFQEAYLEGMRL